MRPLLCLSLVGALCVAHVAQAKALIGDPVRVAIAGRLERAIGLHPTSGAWSLPVGKGGVTRVELVDETSQSHEKWVLEVSDGILEKRSVQLDAARFIAAHSYTVGLYAGAALLESGVVYLYGARRNATTHVRFDTVEPAPAVSDTLGIVPKGSL